MKANPEFSPYIEGAKRILDVEANSHVDKMQPHIVYYGETPEDADPSLKRVSHPAIDVEDGSGVTKYSVLISGDLLQAKSVLVRPMSWSDHPGRGFEALREALIADPDKKLAVIGVSFPGSGFSAEPMTARQRESLKGVEGFSFIGGQQWQAIQKALEMEFKAQNPDISDAEIAGRLRTFDFILAGHSQGASNSVGLFESAPEGIHVASLGLVESVGMEALGWLRFRLNFVQKGSKRFGDYTSVNPYNHYSDLGPDWGAIGLVKNVVARPASHHGSVVKAMRRGNDMQRIRNTIFEKDIESLAVILANGSLGLASVDAAAGEARLLNRTAKVMGLSDSILARTVIWPGHYHAAMENLSNAQRAFRSFAQ